MIITTISNAAEISCYSRNARIYHGYGSDLIFNSDFIAFTETKSSNLIVSTADCIIEIPTEKEQFNPIILKKNKQ